MIKLISAFNQIVLFIILCAGIIEFINHGASWDGVFLAVRKHEIRAETMLWHNGLK